MTIKDLKERVSVRDFTDRKLTEQETKDIIEVINNSPTSTNAQNFSAILITDQEDKDWMSKSNYYQKHIAEAAGILVFLADGTRNEFLKGEAMKTDDLAIHAHSRGMVDATIATTYAQLALQEMGFDGAHIGGILGFGKEFEERFNLPSTAFPVAAFAFGEAAKKNAFKPKVNKVYLGKYNLEQAKEEITTFNAEAAAYYEARGAAGRDFKGQLVGESDPEGMLGKFYGKSGEYYRTTLDRYKK